jgi:hypothetical protein
VRNIGAMCCTVTLHSGSSDVRWLATDGLTAFELQGSTDGANWKYIDRRCGRWLPCTRDALFVQS